MISFFCLSNFMNLLSYYFYGLFYFKGYYKSNDRTKVYSFSPWYIMHWINEIRQKFFFKILYLRSKPYLGSWNLYNICEKDKKYDCIFPRTIIIVKFISGKELWWHFVFRWFLPWLELCVKHLEMDGTTIKKHRSQYL